MPPRMQPDQFGDGMGVKHHQQSTPERRDAESREGEPRLVLDNATFGPP